MAALRSNAACFDTLQNVGILRGFSHHEADSGPIIGIVILAAFIFVPFCAVFSASSSALRSLPSLAIVAAGISMILNNETIFSGLCGELTHTKDSQFDGHSDKQSRLRADYRDVPLWECLSRHDVRTTGGRWSSNS